MSKGPNTPSRVKIVTRRADRAALCMSGLSAAEMATAQRFKFSPDRTAYVTAHHLARQTLAAHFNDAPENGQFEYDTHGKPWLKPNRPPFDFSLSHTRGMVCFSLRDDGPVGVDVEAVSRFEQTSSDIATDLFSVNELALLHQAPPTERARLFALIWTRKEAVSKAMGLGFSLPFDGFDTSNADTAPILVPHNGTLHQFHHSTHERHGFLFSAAARIETGKLVEFDWQDA